MLKPTLRDKPHVYYSWSSWSLPSFSVSSFFKDNDGDLAILKKKITTLEKSQKKLGEAFKLLKQEITATKTPCVSPDKVIAGSNEQTQTKKNETAGSKERNVTDDKKGEAGKNTKQKPAQSVSATINGDSVAVFASATNVDREKLDEEEGTTPPKNDDVQTNASVNGNEENKTAGVGGKYGGSTETTETVENSGAPEELTKPHFEHSPEKNEQPGSLEKDTTEDHRLFLTAEEERRWNTPPELIPEQVIKESKAKVDRSLTIPITANILVNTGNNAQSLGLQAGPQSISYSESNSFNYPGISHSQSVSLAAASSGTSGSLSQAIGQYPNQGNANSQSLTLGSGFASSSSSIQNGHTSSVASSSVSSARPSLSTSIGSTGQSQGASIRFPGENQHRQPVWTNISPSNIDRTPSRLPKLDINVKPHRTQNRRPTLQIWSGTARWEDRQPSIQISKWHPTYRSYYDNAK